MNSNVHIAPMNGCCKCREGCAVYWFVACDDVVPPEPASPYSCHGNWPLIPGPPKVIKLTYCIPWESLACTGQHSEPFDPEDVGLTFKFWTDSGAHQDCSSPSLDRWVCATFVGMTGGSFDPSVIPEGALTFDYYIGTSEQGQLYLPPEDGFAWFREVEGPYSQCLDCCPNTQGACCYAPFNCVDGVEPEDCTGEFYPDTLCESVYTIPESACFDCVQCDENLCEEYAQTALIIDLPAVPLEIPPDPSIDCCDTSLPACSWLCEKENGSCIWTPRPDQYNDTDCYDYNGDFVGPLDCECNVVCSQANLGTWRNVKLMCPAPAGQFPPEACVDGTPPPGCEYVKPWVIRAMLDSVQESFEIFWRQEGDSLTPHGNYVYCGNNAVQPDNGFCNIDFTNMPNITV